jgi:hypothetical protein
VIRPDQAVKNCFRYQILLVHTLSVLRVIDHRVDMTRMQEEDVQAQAQAQT